MATARACCPQRPSPKVQPNNPLYGVTLEVFFRVLVAHYCWDDLGERPCQPCRSGPTASGTSTNIHRISRMML
ncbi:MAG: VF530 family DNA-binding protein [Chromatiaceae bacterium]|nr:VF530 family DNA-binding protein [Chromatiaceae bacterium]